MQECVKQGRKKDEGCGEGNEGECCSMRKEGEYRWKRKEGGHTCEADGSANANQVVAVEPAQWRCGERLDTKSCKFILDVSRRADTLEK
jgi:hypothetical protein